MASASGVRSPAHPSCRKRTNFRKHPPTQAAQIFYKMEHRRHSPIVWRSRPSRDLSTARSSSKRGRRSKNPTRHRIRKPSKSEVAGSGGDISYRQSLSTHSPECRGEGSIRRAGDAPRRGPGISIGLRQAGWRGGSKPRSFFQGRPVAPKPARPFPQGVPRPHRMPQPR